MPSTQTGPTLHLHGEPNTTWRYLVEYLTDDLGPWDRGVLDAHGICCGSTQFVQQHLVTARSRRRGILARISSWRRRYLDGLIWVLGVELERRARVGET